MALEVRYNYPLLKHNTFGIEASSDCFISYGSVEELYEALEIIRGKGYSKILNIGAGSNLLFTGDYKGAVLHSDIRDIEVTDECAENVYLRVGAGYCWDSFVAAAIANGWYGAENLSAIPGDVGAAAVQNIGAYGAEVKDLIEQVEAADVNTGGKRLFSNSECQYSYRNSIFKRTEYKKYVITYVTFRLSAHFEPNLAYRALKEHFEELRLRGLSSECTAAEIRRFVTQMRSSKLPDPAVLGNAGSFFVNPVIPVEQFAVLEEKYPDIPHFDAGEGYVKLSAAWLIDRSGWKGKSLGRAGIYEKQPLVIVNLGGASASGIINLSDAVIDSVKNLFGVELHPEVNFI